MKHIIAFAGSNSKKSINKQLIEYTKTLTDNVNFEVLDLNNYDVPLFGIDLESEIGNPENAKKLLDKLKSSDGLVISLAEHNGAYTSVFKNLFDWMSRLEQKTFMGKPMLLMATSPGGRGGASVLAMAKDRFPRHNAHIIADFSLPSFNDNFLEGAIINSELKAELKHKVELLLKAL